MEANDTDSILAYIFAALTNGSLLNDTYNYRTFHTAILENSHPLDLSLALIGRSPL